MTEAPVLPERQEWTVDDLGELPRDLRYELINRRLVVASPTHPHQDLCVRILLALEANCPDEQYYVSLDTSLRVDRRNEPRPDISVIVPDHNSTSPIPIEDAILAVEVISPDSTFRDLYDTVRLYGRAGVQRCWVVDPQHDDITLTEFVASAAGELEPCPHRGGLHHRVAVEGHDRPSRSDQTMEVQGRARRAQPRHDLGSPGGL